MIIYQLIVESGNGVCVDIVEVMVIVLFVNVEIQGFDFLEICLGIVVDFEVIMSIGAGEILVWLLDNGIISDISGLIIQVIIDIMDWYFVEFIVGVCIVFDFVYIWVDLLFVMMIMLDLEKDKYCEGEIVMFFLLVYEFSFFLDIEFSWVDFLGVEILDILWNMVFIFQDIFLYECIIINRACVDMALILINV